MFEPLKVCCIFLFICTTIHRYPIFSTRYSVICKVYTGHCGTSEIEHGLCACTVDNPLAKARGLSLRTGAQTMLYLSLIFFTYSLILINFLFLFSHLCRRRIPTKSMWFLHCGLLQMQQWNSCEDGMQLTECLERPVHRLHLRGYLCTTIWFKCLKKSQFLDFHLHV